MFPKAGALADLIVHEQAKPCPPSKYVVGLTPGEAKSWDAVQTFLMANPEMSENKAVKHLNISTSQYYMAKKKAIWSGVTMRGPRSTAKESIRPDDPIVKNMPKGPIGIGARELDTETCFDSREIEDVAVADLCIDLPKTKRGRGLKSVLDDAQQSEVVERLIPSKEPENEAEESATVTDRDAFNQICETLEGFEVVVQKRIILAACVFLEIETLEKA